MGGAVVRPLGRPDRRRCRRWRPSEVAWLASARLRTGLDLEVMNLSAGGALVEGGIRLLPGSRLTLQLAGPGACIHVTARVLRCEVVSLRPVGIRYRGAMAFESPLALESEPSHDQGNSLPNACS